MVKLPNQLLIIKSTILLQHRTNMKVIGIMVGIFITEIYQIINGENLERGNIVERLNGSRKVLW